jgi:hypothetical protein
VLGLQTEDFADAYLLACLFLVVSKHGMLDLQVDDWMTRAGEDSAWAGC